MTQKYSADALTRHASSLLVAAGMEPQKAATVAEILVEGDLMGHDTHGLALLGPYLNELANRAMTPTGQPKVINQRPATQVWDGLRLPGGGGSIQLLGGTDAGHKGYGLTLLVESLTGGLAAHGRADPKEGWGATVFVQLLDPEAFGGLEGATRQIDFVAAACHASTPRTPGQPVRLPGERGLARRAEQLASGVVLHPSIAPLLAPWQEKFGIAAPAALA